MIHFFHFYIGPSSFVLLDFAEDSVAVIEGATHHNHHVAPEDVEEADTQGEVLGLVIKSW